MIGLKPQLHNWMPPLLRAWWLWGALALAVGLWAMWLVELRPRVDAAAPPPPALTWDGAEMTVLQGTGSRDGPALELRLNAEGRATVRMPTAGFAAGQHRLLRLRGSGLDALRGMRLIWQTETPPSPVFRSRAPEQSPLLRHELATPGWLAPTWDLGTVTGWRDTVTVLALALRGPPGQTVVIRALSLAPATTAGAAQALVAQWGYWLPWSQSSINFYRADLPGRALGFRVPVAVLFVAAALAAYGLLWLALRRRLPFDWRVAGGIFLLGWVALDAPWQWSLWQQLAATRADYAGKSDRQKALAGLDAGVYRLITDVRPALGPAPARVFIATGSEYLGLRAAYHLYPHNPYWPRGRPQLPPAHRLRSGDFVLVLRPTQVRFDAQAGELAWGRGQRVAAAPVTAEPGSEPTAGDGLGRLYRVL